MFAIPGTYEVVINETAARLTPCEAARLAVMLPRPKYFEKFQNSGCLASRASTLAARMRDAELP